MSVYKEKNGTWTVKISIPLGNKKYDSYREYNFKRKPEANQREKELNGLKKQGLLNAMNAKSNNLVNDNFADYFDDWYSTYKEQTISESTRLIYNYTSRILHEHFDAPMKSITRRDFQKFLNEFGANKARETVKKFRSHVRQAIKSAIHDNIIDEDFTEDTTLVFGNKGKRPEDKYLEKNEVDLLVSSLILDGSHVSDTMIYTALQTGARFSEIAGLKPSNINHKKKTMTISRNWNEKVRKFGPTKNDSSHRTIKISNSLIEVLDQLNSTDEYLFFSKITKRPPVSKSVNNRLDELEEDLNITPITFHGLRHTHASLLLSKGVVINYISQRLGHENTTITMNIYAHMIHDLKEQEEDKSIEYLEDL